MLVEWVRNRYEERTPSEQTFCEALMNRSETNAPRGKDNMTAEGAKRFSPLLALFSCLLRGAGEKRESITTDEHNRIGRYVCRGMYVDERSYCV